VFGNRSVRCLADNCIILAGAVDLDIFILHIMQSCIWMNLDALHKEIELIIWFGYFIY